MDDLLNRMLTDLHESIDLLAADLMRDRPDLANALRLQTINIPRPQPACIAGDGLRSPNGTCAKLPPILYDALDAGVVDARKFDRMMVLKTRAAQTLRGRR